MKKFCLMLLKTFNLVILKNHRNNPTLFCIRMVLEAMPTRLRSLKKFHGRKLEKLHGNDLHKVNNTKVIARKLLILLENFMHINHSGKNLARLPLACVTAARGRKNEALSSVCASAPNSVFYNLFRLFAISNAYSD